MKQAWPMFVGGLMFSVVLIAMGCIAPEPLVRTATITNEVKVAVPIACVKREDIPPLPKPTPVDVERATTDQIAAATEADLRALEQWAAIAAPLLAACAELPERKP